MALYSQNCLYLTIPTNIWFDITQYIDITGTVDSFSYFYLNKNNCIYNIEHCFKIRFNTINISTVSGGRYYVTIAGWMRISNQKILPKIEVYTQTSILLELINGINSIYPNFITGVCVDTSQLLSIYPFYTITL